MKAITTLDVYKMFLQFYKSDTTLMGELFNSTTETGEDEKFYYLGSKKGVIYAHLAAEPSSHDIFDFNTGNMTHQKWKKAILNCPTAMYDNIRKTVIRIGNDKQVLELHNQFCEILKVLDLEAYTEETLALREKTAQMAFIVFMYTIGFDVSLSQISPLFKNTAQQKQFAEKPVKICTYTSNKSIEDNIKFLTDKMFSISKETDALLDVVHDCNLKMHTSLNSLYDESFQVGFYPEYLKSTLEKIANLKKQSENIVELFSSLLCIEDKLYTFFELEELQKLKSLSNSKIKKNPIDIQIYNATMYYKGKIKQLYEQMDDLSSKYKVVINDLNNILSASSQQNNAISKAIPNIVDDLKGVTSFFDKKSDTTKEYIIRIKRT